MKLTPIHPNIENFPDELRSLITGARLFDSSCSPEASVIYIDKDNGYFLKSAAKGSLERESILTKYYHSKNLAAEVLSYISDEKDWLLTSKVQGDDCTTKKYLEQPKRLSDTVAEWLTLLHKLEYADCPVQYHTERYLAKAAYNKLTDNFDKSHFPDSFGYASAEEAWEVIEKQSHLLESNTLLHGDYCLPNIILNNWKFSGFIDVDSGGVGDRHVDLFWGMWSLHFNLRTDKYSERFKDAYGRDKIDEEMLRIVAAVEVFG